MQIKKHTVKYKPFFYPFPDELHRGTIISRYKRFLADIRLENGRTITAHVPNSGSMQTCWEPDAEVIVSEHVNNGQRKLQHTLQSVKMPDGWVCVNTMHPNKAVAEAIIAGALPDFTGYELITTEVKTETGSRFDLVLLDQEHLLQDNSEISINQKRLIQVKSATTSKQHARPALIEIKNATLLQDDGVAFPDAVTERGQKHLEHLILLKNRGYRTIICFFAARSSARWVKAAEHIDKKYAGLLKKAVNSGVEAVAVKVEVLPEGLQIEGHLPVLV